MDEETFQVCEKGLLEVLDGIEGLIESLGRDDVGRVASIKENLEMISKRIREIE